MLSEQRTGRGLVQGIILSAGLIATFAGRVDAAISVIDGANLQQNVITAINQIKEVAQQVKQLTNEATQIAHQISMLEDMAAQASQIADLSPSKVGAWIDTAAATAEVGQSIVYRIPRVARQLQVEFPGYASPTDWNAQSERWSQTTLDTLRGTLAGAGRNISDVSTVEEALNVLRVASNGATGRNELLQAANSLAGLQIEEMTKLRQLLALEINARNVWATSETNKEAAGQAALENFIGTAPVVVDPRTQPGFEGF